MKFSRLVSLVLLLVVVALGLTILHAYNLGGLPDAVPMTARWLALIAMVAYAFSAAPSPSGLW